MQREKVIKEKTEKEGIRRQVRKTREEWYDIK